MATGFAALLEAEKTLPFSPSIVPANDNDTEGSLSFLRKAINAPDIPEVKRICEDIILNYNLMNKIELKRNGETISLPDTPRHFLFPEILAAVNANIPVSLVGPAGAGKSTLSQQIADALQLKYYLQNSVSGAHELEGFVDAHGKYKTTTFRRAFELGGLMLIDEVDTSDAGALKWLNTAIANGHAMFPDNPEPITRHKDFRIMIGANTFGNGADRVYVGANQLDASTLDRFVFFDFGYDEKMEIVLSGNADWARKVQNLRKAAFDEKARMVISPRASINGAKLLAIGWSEETVLNRVIWKGIDPDLRKRIEDKASGLEKNTIKIEVVDKSGNKKRR